ncbi:TPA: hypothetical protein EYP83_02365, partial [Candidatus Geothermarchaeota archaeon]|nr:hypothetical protein [Candidatus Geothermarchaeota archaeon]
MSLVGSGGELLIERLAGLLQDHLDLLSSIKTHISYIRAGGGDRGELEGYISSLREIRASIHQGFEEALNLAFKGDIDVEDL